MKKRVLILAPHTDDAELGCGGSIARMLEQDADLHIAAFSTAEESLPASVPKTQLRDEFMKSMKIFGISEDRIHIYNYPVRKLSYNRQEVLEELIRLRGSFAPEWVFGPASSDLHQDHQVLHAECMRAFKEITVFGYELPWNHVNFSANGFIIIDRSHLERKWQSMTAYTTQLELKRPYFSFEFVESLARVRGVQVKALYAEAFEVLRVRI